MKTLGSLALLSFLSLNCSSQYSNSYTLHISPSFSDDEIAIIWSDVADWEHKTNVHFNVIMENVDCEDLSTDYNVCIHAATWKHTQEQCEDKNAIGCTTIQETFIGVQYNSNISIALDHPYLDTNVYGNSSYDLMTTTIAHELGHSIGLDHTDNENDLMYYKPKIGKSITCNDVRQYANLRDIKLPCKENTKQLINN